MSTEKIPVAANILGTIGTILWCVQLVPQIIYNWRRKNTEGLPPAMMMCWAVSGVPFGAYAIIQDFNIPIQCQAQIFSMLSLITFAQCIHYSKGWSTLSSIFLTLSLAVFFGGVEAAMVFSIKKGQEHGTHWPILFIGIVATVLVSVGLLPPYFELFKRQGQVVGINFLFIAIDWSGAFFSLMSLIAQRSFDVLGGVLYIMVIVLEIGIVASHLTWLFRTRKVRKAQSGKRISTDLENATIDEKEVEIFPDADVIRPPPALTYH